LPLHRFVLQRLVNVYAAIIPLRTTLGIGVWFIRLAAPQSSRMHYTPAPEKSKGNLSELLPFLAGELSILGKIRNISGLLKMHRKCLKSVGL
jgi:hypothetical protein